VFVAHHFPAFIEAHPSGMLQVIVQHLQQLGIGLGTYLLSFAINVWADKLAYYNFLQE
jgi:hypothetical protein